MVYFLCLILAFGMAGCAQADTKTTTDSKTPAASQQDAYQASKRGGYLHCRMEENHRIVISGKVTLVAISEIAVAL